MRTQLERAEFIGSFMRRYLFFGQDNSLLVIDQHAACERINYEKFLSQLEAGRIESQQLLEPVIISLSETDRIAYKSSRQALEKMGFSVSLWGEGSLAIHAYPQLITNPEIAVRNIMGLEESEGPLETIDKESLARRACHNSVRSGYRMSVQEAGVLRQELLLAKQPFSCPHGRPTVIEIKEDSLQKQFLRR